MIMAVFKLDISSPLPNFQKICHRIVLCPPFITANPYNFNVRTIRVCSRLSKVSHNSQACQDQGSRYGMRPIVHYPLCLGAPRLTLDHTSQHYGHGSSGGTHTSHRISSTLPKLNRRFPSYPPYTERGVNEFKENMQLNPVYI